MKTFKTSRSKNRSVWAGDLRSRVLTIWETARKEGRTHAQILEARTREIYDSPVWLKLASYERAEINAFFHACSDMAYRRDIVWRLGPVEGPLPETADGMGVWGEGSPLSTLCRIPGALYGGHFWRGTEKTFSGYTCTNEDRTK